MFVSSLVFGGRAHGNEARRMDDLDASLPMHMDRAKCDAPNPFATLDMTRMSASSRCGQPATSTLPAYHLGTSRRSKPDRTMLRLMAKAPSFNSSAFRDAARYEGGQVRPGKLDVREGSHSAWLVANRPDTLKTWRTVYKTFDRATAERALDELVSSVLPMLTLDGEPLELDDLQ